MRIAEQNGKGYGTESDLKQVIDDNLRRVYADVRETGVPDRFHRLLSELRATRDQK
jgi:hypothetical protein